MVYFILILIVFLAFYIHFSYKNNGFFLYSKYGLPYVALFVAFFISFISFFSYQIHFNQKQKYLSSDIFFVIDVSSSMNALDYDDNSRLQVAKKFISNYVSNNLQNRYWLSIFAWDSVDLLPLTTDKDLFNTFLQSVDSKSILRWWTNLFSALNWVISRFDDSPNWWAVIVISDFETNLDSESKKSLIEKINELNEELIKKNIKLIFIWVWKKSWSKIPIWNDLFWNTIYKRDKFNNLVITKFDEDFFNSFSLQKYKIDNISDISKIEFKDIPVSSIELDIGDKVDISRYFMMVSFLFFLTYLFLFSYFDKKWK